MSVEIHIFTRKEEVPPLPDKVFSHFMASFDLYQSISSYQPMMVVAYRDEKPVAAMFAYIMRINRFLYGSVFKRCYVSQQPAFFEENPDKEALMEEMLTALLNQVKWNVFFIEFRNLESTVFGYKSFRQHRFFSIKHINMRVEIEKNHPAWNELSARRRNRVTKAKRRGVKIEELTSPETLPLLYTYIEKTKNWRFTHHLPPYRYFENFYTHYVLQGKGKIFITKYQDKIIGGIIVGFENNKLISLYDWGHNNHYRLLHPSSFAIWHTIEYAEKNGFECVDFLESGYFNQKTGRIRSLLQFGGIEKATRRWYRFNWRVLNFLMRRIYN